MKRLASVLIPVAFCVGYSCSDSENSSVDGPTKDRNSDASQMVAKLERIVFPEVPFGDTSVEDAFGYIYSKSIELDPEPDPKRKGLTFRASKPTDSAHNQNEAGTEAGTRKTYIFPPRDSGLKLALDDEQRTARVSFSAENIKLLDLVAEVAARSRLDAYLTSRAVVIVPEGGNPIQEGSEDEEIWRVIRKAP